MDSKSSMESGGDYEIVAASVCLPILDVILLANPKSGSNKARAYLSHSSRIYHLKHPSKTVNIHIFSLQETESRAEACAKALELLQFSNFVRVIIAGGDGSLIWAVDTFTSFNVPLSNIYFSILPFGSGNDLSANLGWGRDPPSDLFDPYMYEWVTAVPHHFDIWLVTVEVQPAGGIGTVHLTQKSFNKSFLQDGQNKKLKFTKLMSNYFSIGLDARIGLGFDKHRTSTKGCNRLRYGWEGLKKMCCCIKTAKINELVHKVTSESEGVIVDNGDNNLALMKNTMVLLALNIRTYGGGDNYVWDKARSVKRREWDVQSPCDNKIELLGFAGKMSLGLEQIKCTQGQAKRIAQGLGPFNIDFAENDSKSYLQIDGEYFYLENPKKVRIELWERSKEVNLLFRSEERKE